MPEELMWPCELKSWWLIDSGWRGSALKNVPGSVHWLDCLWLLRIRWRMTSSDLRKTKGVLERECCSVLLRIALPLHPCVLASVWLSVHVWEKVIEREKARGRVDVCSLLHSLGSVSWTMLLAVSLSLSSSLYLSPCACLAVPLSAKHWWTILCNIAAIAIAAFLSSQYIRKHMAFHRHFVQR